ncbi:MAG: hypothetical protein K6E51_01100 [Treponema sp.]|nr:hypothetical protein [Treponema sp.]
MISNLGSLNAYSYNSFVSANATGKLYVPVKPMSVVYAQFDHISGVAAKSGQQGVSISKIQILNTLIDRLSKIQTQPQPEIKLTGISDEYADALIHNYQSQIESTVQAAKSAPYALAGVQPEAGALFSIAV